LRGVKGRSGGKHVECKVGMGRAVETMWVEWGSGGKKVPGGGERERWGEV